MSESLMYFDGIAYQPMSSKVQCVDSIKEIEALKEQGLLVELPWPIGRYVYNIKNGEINRFLALDMQPLKGIDFKFLDPDTDICYVIDKNDIGKTVFLAKDEAQVALLIGTIQDKIIKDIAKQELVKVEYGDKISIPPSFLEGVYQKLDIKKIKAKLIENLENEMADKIANKLITEYAEVIKGYLQQSL